MKIFVTFLILLFLNTGLDKKEAFEIEIEKEQLLKPRIELHHKGINNNEKFSIKGFKIKFPGYPTEVLKGSSLNSDTRKYLRTMREDDIIVIFDIKEARNEHGKILGKVPAFKIKVKN